MWVFLFCRSLAVAVDLVILVIYLYIFVKDSKTGEANLFFLTLCGWKCITGVTDIKRVA